MSTGVRKLGVEALEQQFAAARRRDRVSTLWCAPGWPVVQPQAAMRPAAASRPSGVSRPRSRSAQVGADPNGAARAVTARRRCRPARRRPVALRPHAREEGLQPGHRHLLAAATRWHAGRWRRWTVGEPARSARRARPACLARENASARRCVPPCRGRGRRSASVGRRARISGHCQSTSRRGVGQRREIEPALRAGAGVPVRGAARPVEGDGDLAAACRRRSRLAAIRRGQQLAPAPARDERTVPAAGTA